MGNKFGIIFQVVAAILGIIIPVLGIIYRKKFLELQIRYFSRQKDFFSRRALEGLKSKSDVSNFLLLVVVGLFIITFSVIQLIKIL